MKRARARRSDSVRRFPDVMAPGQGRRARPDAGNPRGGRRTGTGGACNEAARIGAPLGEMGAFLSAQTYRSEIVVIVDGSTDETCEVVRRIAPTLPVPLRLVR